MKVFDDYEINSCTRTEEPDRPGHFYFEVCEPEDADVWTLYGHIDGEGVEAIGDFRTREHAEDTYSRITGQAFPGSCRSADRLRVMHAGPKLLEALTYLLEQTVDQDVNYGIALSEGEQDARAKALAVIADATGRAA
jgi:hypothetical protein